MKYRQVGRPPLRSYLTAGMEANRKGKSCTAMTETAMQLDVNWVKNNKWTTARDQNKYRQVSNIRRTLIGNEIVDNSDVVRASPVGAAPTTSSLST